MKTVYVSGPLTGISNPRALKTFYESIGRVCLHVGFNPYIPHQHSDPLQHPNMTPQAVYELDRQNVSQSDVVIAYVGIPAIGVGQEVEIAHTSGVPVILVYEAGRSITRMVRGNPSIFAEVSGTGPQAILSGLATTLML